jgi:hypothetical protein
MKTRHFKMAIVVALLSAGPAAAHHVVWLDFSQWNLSAWTSVNGNNPPTAADIAAVREQVIANMVEDWAPFDIYFTTVQPPNGRYTRIYFYPVANGTLYGCAGGSCCLNGNCSGRGTWTSAVSNLEVYTGTFAGSNRFTGANATTARIANGISHTASHEFGHVMGMTHCYAADDFVSSGTSCSDGYAATGDANVNWHMMASGASSGLTTTQRATRDRFFNAHSERRLLYDQLQPRNHWAPLGNVNAGVGRSDLTYGRLQSPTAVQWYARLSSGSGFGDYTTWASDAGQRADLFMTADVTGDGRADLVFGRIVNATTVRWYVKPSSGTSFGTTAAWATDAGDAGDIFRLGDVDADGRADLVYGRPFSASQVTWYVRLSTGTAFGPFTTWRDEAGSNSDLFFLADVTGDGRNDLVACDRTLLGSRARVYRSTGTGFAFEGDDTLLSFTHYDYVLMGDVDGDGEADLIGGTVNSSTDVDWRVFESKGCSGGIFGFGECFDLFGDTWANGAGDAGDLFRLGDGNGDGRADLFYARPIGMTSLTAAPDLTRIRWFGRLSSGSLFDPYTVWANDAGDEGDIFP